MSELFSLLQQSPVMLAVALFIFGACMGSFLNVVALRIPPMIFYGWKSQCHELLESDEFNEPVPANLIRPKSHCSVCRTPLLMRHNLPLLGFLLLRGRCGFCGTKISWRYPIVELAAAIASSIAGFYFGIGWVLAFALGITYTLITLTLIDFDHHLLPDVLVLPLLWAGLLINTQNSFTDLKSAVVGAAVGYLSLWAIYQIHRLLTGREGMGYGDFKLCAAIGAWFGWQMLPIVILVASMTGILFAISSMLINKTGRDIPFAFGPFLALGGWVVLLWGNPIARNYLSLL